MSVQENVIRPTANFPPSVWGDQFLTYDEREDQAGLEKVVEDLKDKLRQEILGTLNVPTQHTNLLRLIDSIQRLGIAYHFEEEVDRTLHHFYDTYGDNWTGGATSIWFRVMRQQGFFVSSDVFKSYKDKNGAFKEPLENDVAGLLELYEATYLRVPGEVILDDALAFTKARLDDISNDPLWRNSIVSTQIIEALKQPMHKRVPRLEALRYIAFYQQQASCNESLLKLAKLDFNLLQSLHKKELSQVYKWWKGFEVPTNLAYARNRMVECYFWSLSVFFEPKYSQSRMFLAKVISVATILDDTYDAYGIYEELEIFTAALHRYTMRTCHPLVSFQFRRLPIKKLFRWSVTCLDALPEKYKLVYRMLLSLYEDMEKILTKMGKAHHLNYIREAMMEYIGCYLKEAKWANEEYIPTMEEHKEVTTVSSGYKFTLIASFAAMGDVITDETFKWALTMPPLAKACCVLCRVMDDIVTHKEEQERKHVASGIQCYMKEFDVTEQHVYNVFNTKVEHAWVEMNEESLKCKDVKLPIIMRVINLARAMDVLYKNKDHYTHVGPELINHIKSLVVDPIMA
ncbi:Alpha-isocomene synthase [Artemisia annua]|uniref:Alpha-isocomene synthase n=1 Tax=Artemisia annua TaxID=35608 RepID=A0A2U1PDY1_ARTAN|nr:Alpha-isocomene synthase [Artemisia annua]